MNDDIDDLKAMMTDATPKPDAQRRSQNLSLAQRNFDALQRDAPAPKPTGLWAKVSAALDVMMSKGVVTSASVVVAGVLVVSPIGQDLWRAPSPSEPVAERLTVEAAQAPQATKTQITPEADMMGEVEDFDARVAAPQAAAPQAAARQSESTYGAALADQAFELPLDTPLLIGNGNQTLKTVTAPISTFSPVLRSDGLSVLEEMIVRDQVLPTAADVRIEDLLNSITFAYTLPQTEEVLAVITVLPTPWNDQTQLVHIGITAGDAALRDPLGRVTWAPDTVSTYRLIGYEGPLNAGAPQETMTGSIPAGRSVTAIYEITRTETTDLTRPTLGAFSLRFTDPQTGTDVVKEQPLLGGKTVQNHVKTAVAVAGFGQLLRDDPTMGDWTYQDALEYLASATSIKINRDPRQALPAPEQGRLLTLFSTAKILNER